MEVLNIMNLNRLNFIRSYLLVLLAFYASISHAETPATYIFSVIPQYKLAQLQKEWSPVLERITRETGIQLKLTIPRSLPIFEAEYTKGTPDFAYMNPYEAVMAKKGNGYLPMLRDKKPLHGILVVRKDSPYKTIQDLEGKVIGFPSPNSFGASLYIRALLSENNPIKFTPRYLINHNHVFRYVTQGVTAAGGSVNAALNDEPPEIREQLKVLYQTPDVASHPIVAHPRVPEQVRKSVMNSLLGMQKDDAGRAMLKEIRMPNLVDADFQKDYQPLEKLNLQKYLVPETE